MLDHEYAFLSYEQAMVAHMFVFTSCALSFIGSGNIVFLALTRKGLFTDPSSIYHRIVFGLSVMDIITTLALFLNPFLVREDLGYILAIGNVRTCEFVGVLFQAYTGSLSYNAVLSLYFLLSVRYQRNPAQLSRLLEPWIHIGAVAVPVVFGVAGVLLETFNSSLVIGGACVHYKYPWNCGNDIECERGAHAATVRYFQVGLVVTFSAIGTICTWLVYWTIRQQTVRVRRWSVTSGVDDDIHEERRRKRTHAVGWQAIYYTLAFLGMTVAIALVSIVIGIYTPKVSTEELVGNKVVYTAILFLWLVFPLQGFFNWIIYVRPRLVRWKEVHPKQSWIWAYRQVLSHKSTRSTPLVRNKPPVKEPSSYLLYWSEDDKARKSSVTMQPEAGDRDCVYESLEAIDQQSPDEGFKSNDGFTIIAHQQKKTGSRELGSEELLRL